MSTKKSMRETLMLIDSHSHLDSISDLEVVINRAKSEGIDKIITVGTSIESSKKSIEIADNYSSDPTSSHQTRLRGASDLKIYATVGIHPKDGKNDVLELGLYQCINTLKQLVESSDKVVGIGECGLDYYLTTDKKPTDAKALVGRQLTTDEEKKFQRELFEAQIKLASELDLPLVIHCRNAWNDVFSLLTTDYRLPTKLKGVFHSFTGDWREAQKALGLGFYISFSGIVTYRFPRPKGRGSLFLAQNSLHSKHKCQSFFARNKNAKNIQEVAKKAPLDRILVETDSPFLAPEPFRRAKNEPKNVRIVAQFVADLRDLPFDKIAEETSQNTRQLFGI